jgi:DNA-binding NarL/FixJ family response regulator
LQTSEEGRLPVINCNTMEKANNHLHLDLDTKEGKAFVQKIRLNVAVDIEIDDDNNANLKISVEKDSLYRMLSEFLRHPTFDLQLKDNLNTEQSRLFKINNPAMKVLTPREIEIMDRLSEGPPLKIIAYELNMSIDTVKTHMKTIYNKLSVKKVSKAVIEYLKLQGMFQQNVAEIRIDVTTL